MISSAVVIPEEQPSISSSSPTSLKRRPSSFTTDSNKRPRLDTRSNFENGANEGQGSPTRPKSSATPTSAVEEKKRGKRLFGALLGTLSQTSSKPAHRKRDEIEQKQRERLRKDNEERDQAARRNREELDRIRRIEQKEWNVESTKLRHANMRATANFLQTKTEPRLYYKPWDLRPEEEVQIKTKIEEVEELIRAESSGAQQRPGDNQATGTQHHSQANNTEEQPLGDNEDRQTLGNDIKPRAEEQQERNVSDQPQPPVEQHAEVKTDHQKDDDHGGGELVEGREDDIMY